MSKDLYSVLGVSKNATDVEIKKAYKKMAMKYHPDRNQGDKEAEKKFKEVNNAYSVLSDSQKRKQYDMFGSTWWAGWNPFSGAWWTWGFSWFEDIFSWWGFGGWQSTWGFNFEDLFWWFSSKRSWGNPFSGGNSQSYQKEEEKEETLDFEKTYEVPIFDLILGCKIEVRGVYGSTAKLKIPASTKPGTKFRVKWFWKKEWSKIWNLIVKVEALMPKNISDVDMQMLERIRENVGY